MINLLLLLSLCVCALGDGVTPNTPKFEPLYEVIPTARIEFLTGEGRTADPCNVHTTTAQPHCDSVPDPQVTILLPSEGSIGSATVAAIKAGTQPPITLTGRGFTAGQTYTYALSNPGTGCYAGQISTLQTATSVVTGTTSTFFIPAAWIAVSLELESAPRSLCVSTPAAAGAFFYTGFKVGVVWDCDSQVTSKQCPPTSVGALYENTLTFAQVRQRAVRRTCCKGSLGTLGVGQCILSSATSPQGAPTACCGSSAIELSTQKCCNGPRELSARLNQACTCYRGATGLCPVGESCCLPTKYPELVDANGSPFTATGECYDPSKHSCCDTGARYDPGSHQCCVINGLQSLNIPCPCAQDGDCWGAQAGSKFTNLRCCGQINNAAPNEIAQCTKYANYPTGTGPAQSQRCPGNCFDPSYQICCNGVQCIKSYEKCCNQTCCNRVTQTCETARRSAAPGNPANWNDFYTTYEVCSTIEQMSPHRALWLFVYPTIWLLMTLLSTGLVLVFANKAASRSYAAIERALITVALINILFSLVFYFSVAYKYIQVILFVQLFNILTAAVRVRKLNIVTLVLNGVLLIYLFDPFHGNQYLTLASSRTTKYLPDRDTAGLIHILGKQYRNSWAVQTNQFCPKFYLGFGLLDPNLRDLDRFDNPAIMTFAYCSRGYTALLLIFASIVMLFSIIQFLLSLLALILRFAKPSVKLVVHEELDEQPFVAPQPVASQYPLLAPVAFPQY